MSSYDTLGVAQAGYQLVKYTPFPPVAFTCVFILILNGFQVFPSLFFNFELSKAKADPCLCFITNI